MLFPRPATLCSSRIHSSFILSARCILNNILTHSSCLLISLPSSTHRLRPRHHISSGHHRHRIPSRASPQHQRPRIPSLSSRTQVNQPSPPRHSSKARQHGHLFHRNPAGAHRKAALLLARLVNCNPSQKMPTLMMAGETSRLHSQLLQPANHLYLWPRHRLQDPSRPANLHLVGLSGRQHWTSSITALSTLDFSPLMSLSLRKRNLSLRSQR